jgi:hypothetical protein
MREVPEGLLAHGFRMENRATAATDDLYLGDRGWQEWLDDLLGIFASGARYGVEDIVRAGEDFVAAKFFIVGLGARSREPLEFHWAGVTWFHRGRATRAVSYPSVREALEALEDG